MAEAPEGSSPGQDLLMFLGIFVLLFILWLYTGGPERLESREGPTVEAPVSQESSSSSGSWFRGSFGVGGTSSGIGNRSGTQSGSASGGNIGSELSKIQKKVDTLGKEIQAVVEFGTPSPHRGEVTIEKRTSGVKSTNNQTEYIVLRANSRNPSAVNITGWRLISGIQKSDGAYSNAFIPNGSNLPKTGEVNPVYGISLSPGERAYVVTGSSPIGVSFRENMCSGYLTQYQTFTPSLARSCPAPIDDLKFAEQPIPYQNNCEAYVRSLPRCQIVLKKTPPQYGTECDQFVKRELTYNACVDNHKYLTNFYKSDWRIFLNQQRELWRSSRDIIKLLDAEGKTVDIFTY
jgi:hypothetical protein